MSADLDRPSRRPRPTYKKKYGQHHLRSGRSCRPLLAYLAPDPSMRIVEIGPGGGVLTAELHHIGARVLALEVDVEWACHLRRQLPPPSVQVLCADALDFPWQQLAELEGPTLVTGNLPFNVGTRLIRDVLGAACAAPESMPRLGFMVQKEVADRLVARPGQAAYGALSVLVAARSRVKSLGELAPGAFRPPPKVSAAFVALDPQLPPFDPPKMAAFDRTVHLAFGQRRKTLRNSLASGWGRETTDVVLARAGIDPGVRAETLDVTAFVALHASFVGHEGALGVRREAADDKV